MSEATSKSNITSFPTESLKNSIILVKRIIEERGEQVSTAKDIAVATGIGVGTLPLPLSTACQYGILVSSYGSGYRPTELFHRIQNPTFDHERAEAEFEALSTPPLYRRIIQEFNGKQLPNEAGFANYLLKVYGFKQYAIPRIVKAFFENFRPSIDANNKLRFAQQKRDGMETVVEQMEQVVETRALPQTTVKERQSNFQQPIPLPGDKMIVLEYPKGNMTADDFAALKAFISFLELSEGLKKEKRNE